MYSSKPAVYILPTRPKLDKLNLHYFVMTIFIHIYGTLDLGEAHRSVYERGLTFCFLCLKVWLMLGALPHRYKSQHKRYHTETQLALDLGLVCCVSQPILDSWF